MEITVQDGFSLPPSRSSLPVVDYDGFFDIVTEAMQLHMDSQQLAEDRRPILVREYPKERLAEMDKGQEFISYAIHHVSMGGTATDGVGRVPRKPVLRESVSSPDKSFYVRETYGWWENVVVEFTIWAKSELRASQLALWFHRFMMRYGTVLEFFRARGVQNFRFEERLADRFHQETGQELSTRCLRYSIRIEFLETYEKKTLEVVNVQVPESEPIEIDARKPTVS